ncbi:MAG: exopolysaccharide biosynthesis polyprenyl glycosylphosphotransferase [Micropepsaceae bacterium]
MSKLYENDDFLNAPEVSGDDYLADTKREAELAVERALPLGVLQFVPQRARRPAGPMQMKGARLIVAVSESLSIVAASLIAGTGYHALVLGASGNAVLFLSVGLLAAILFSGTMHSIESSQRLRSMFAPEAVRDVTLVWLATILLVTFFAFSLKAGDALSRGSMLTFLVLGYVGALATRATVPALLRKHYRPERLVAHQVIVIGAEGDPALDTLLAELGGAGYSAPRIVRFHARCGLLEWQREFSESIARVVSLARTAADGEICIAAGGFDDRRLKEIVTALQILPRAVCIIPTPHIEQLLHFPIRNIGGLNSVELQKAPLNPVQRAVKRTMDVALSSAALLFLAPFFLVVAPAIRVTSSGSAIFKQTRLGHRGVPFDILKFRTMTVVENGAVVKQAQVNDRRVTWIGRWLRKTSIDELPQLINVLRGQMSLVGPRPHAVAHDHYYTMLIDNYDIRQHVKPGITGWAQVNGYRGETSSPDLMRKRVEFDIWYAKNSSILLDIRILFLTVVEVLRQRNAH